MTRLSLFLTSATVVALLTAGCDSASLDVGGPVDASTVEASVSGVHVLTGFAVPEAALYDPLDDVYYVTNVSDPFGGGGFVSRISPNAMGDVSAEPDYEWITGLTSPFGMALDGDVLYVVDRDGLYSFLIDRSTGDASPNGFIPLGTTGSLLNDVCLWRDGSIYVTDTGLDLIDGPTGTDAVYRIQGDDVSVLLAGPHLEGPNGCFVDGANVYWTTFFANKLYRTNPSGRIFVAATLPEGGIDSVVRIGGSFFLSSWGGEGVYRTSLGGARPALIAEVGTPGSMGYDAVRGRLLVPSVFSENGEVHVVTLQ